jgi:hypothetical protein
MLETAGLTAPPTRFFLIMALSMLTGFDTVFFATAPAAVAAAAVAAAVTVADLLSSLVSDAAVFRRTSAARAAADFWESSFTSFTWSSGNLPTERGES